MRPAYRDSLRTFAQESVAAEDQAGLRVPITPEQARQARVAAARFCLGRGLGREAFGELVDLLGIGGAA